MGYIVDLTIVMRKLSDDDSAQDVSKESIQSALENVTKGDIIRIHRDIRKFLDTKSTARLVDKDYVLDKIVNLIRQYCST